MSSICENYNSVLSRIRNACEKVGRNPREVTLVAVSKTVGIDEMNLAMQCGCLDFGENRVQDFLKKHEVFEGRARFHMIGHLQTNKVRNIVGKASLIHSVDSMRLLEEIEHRAAIANVVQDILIQVDVSGEESKFGAAYDEMMEMIEANENNRNVRIRGLMTMAPYDEDPEKVRWVFRKLKALQVDTRSKTFYNTSMEYTSMGMSNDFEVAVEEGADIVRVGSSIFHDTH
ncbi:MAG TPA: YggS family pyridoxal phosphate-dependent enzyme [Clostridia bacterium]|nr:YggS family pyridoxal phosphate-dependent enzyme [Clostridia bacterium]